MSEAATIVSKVLVHEIQEACMTPLKEFLSTHNLVGLKASSYNSIMETLKSTIDLGAVLLCEEADSSGKSGLEIADQIHKLRPELPIFLRRNHSEEVPAEASQTIAGVYQIQKLELLKKLVDKHLFNTYYPSGFIRGIEELSLQALLATFHETKIECGTPYLIRDRIIYGELFSMIPLEGNWCRGYMMLQAEEEHLRLLMAHGKTVLPPQEMDFRNLNSLMSEVTNMIWGGFKSRFFSNAEHNKTVHRVHVPIIVNHNRKYITFGVEDPQLCFPYTLTDIHGKFEPITLYQKFVFHLGWAPDEFQESPSVVEELVQAGELELF